MSDATVLSANETEALRWIRRVGSLSSVMVPDRNDRDDVFGTVQPGRAVFKKLETKGLCYETEPDEIEPGLFLRTVFELTDLGKATIDAILADEQRPSTRRSAGPRR